MDLEVELKLALQSLLQSEQKKSPQKLADSVRYSLLAPGKRIRPRLLLATSEMLALNARDLLPAALALEMIHCFTLIHDDLPCMDDDDFRRGRPSNHKQFGESTALLAGDALLAAAFECFLKINVDCPSPAFKSALGRLAWASGPRGVIGGQGFEEELSASSTLVDLQKMHALKTGALFEASILVPMDLAQVSPHSAEGKALSGFAHELGLAFQTVDDLDDKETDPRSILHYMNEHQAKLQTAQALGQSQAELSRIWGDRARGVLSISNEVYAKVTS